VEIEKPEWLEQMEGILETVNEGVLISDNCGHVLFVNSVFEEMTGITRDEIMGRDAGKLYYSAEDYAVLEERRNRTRQTGRSREEFFLPTKAGGRVPVVASVRAIEDPDGREFAVVTFTDISEQKAAEAGLRQANARLEQYRSENEEDLALAASVQQSLAPQSLVWSGVRVETFYQPARTIGGDFGLVTPMANQSGDLHLNLLVCDVSGHGIGSALVANRIYTETVTHFRGGAPLGSLLCHLNRFVMQDIGSSGFFFTVAAARLAPGGRRMVLAVAGHPPVMVVPQGGKPLLLESRSMVLGAWHDAVASEPTLDVDLRQGDRVVLYTDGITDVFNSRGEMLGVEGLQDFVGEAASLPLAKMKEGILARVAAWRDGPATDDVSLILAEVL
jgi:sigma-B regulation protein RsbU (phosphoserine phosphatase)